MHVWDQTNEKDNKLWAVVQAFVKAFLQI